MKINLYEFLFFFKSFQFHEADELPTIDSVWREYRGSAGSDNSFESICDGPSGDANFSQQSVSHEALEMEVGDEVVSSCVTPWKFLAVKDIL